MIVFENKGYETRSDMPASDWTGKAAYVIPDDSVLAEKIKKLYPYYEFVINSGELVDIIQIDSPTAELTPAEKRELEYQIRRYKEDESELLPWGGKALTVDEANKAYLEYLAEGSSKATEIQTLIIAAKSYIRELYPDVSEV